MAICLMMKLLIVRGSLNFATWRNLLGRATTNYPRLIGGWFVYRDGVDIRPGLASRDKSRDVFDEASWLDCGNVLNVFISFVRDANALGKLQDQLLSWIQEGL